jgi:hypothetical protein
MLQKYSFKFFFLFWILRDEELLANDDEDGNDVDDEYEDDEDDVRTLKNPALEELSPGNYKLFRIVFK